MTLTKERILAILRVCLALITLALHMVFCILVAFYALIALKDFAYQLIVYFLVLILLSNVTAKLFIDIIRAQH
jgi:hypothetical protein